MPMVIGHDTAQARKRAIADWNGFTRGLLGMTVTALTRPRVLHGHASSTGEQQCQSDPPTAQCGGLPCEVGLAVPSAATRNHVEPNGGDTVEAPSFLRHHEVGISISETGGTATGTQRWSGRSRTAGDTARRPVRPMKPGEPVARPARHGHGRLPIWEDMARRARRGMPR